MKSIVKYNDLLTLFNCATGKMGKTINNTRKFNVHFHYFLILNVAVLREACTQPIELVKNAVGSIYWPYYGLNTIGNMIPGEGYQVKPIDPIVFYYPNNTSYTQSKSIEDNIEVYEYYQELYINTDNFMIVGIPVEAWDVIPQVGDEIAAIGEHGQVTGRAVYQGGFMGMVIYGDDLYTQGIIEGLSNEEEFTLEIWNGLSKAITNFKIEDWIQGDGQFGSGKINIAGIKVAEEAVNNANPFTALVHPNPSNGYFNIDLISTIETNIDVSVYDHSGKLIQSDQDINVHVGRSLIELDLTSRAVGSYVVHLASKDHKQKLKLIIVR
jgi:hypothetical protein